MALKSNIESEGLSPSQMAWARFKQNKLAVFGLSIIALATFIAVLGSFLRPDSSVDANNQELVLSKKPIGFKVKGIEVHKNQAYSASGFFSRLFFGGKDEPVDFLPIETFEFSNDSIRGFEYSGTDSIPGRPYQVHLADVLFPVANIESQGNEYQVTLVSGEIKTTTTSELLAQVERESLVERTYWLGTDKFGRDLLSRLMAGTIVSLSVGFISVFISLVLGIGLGALAGYYGGWIDDIITWLINVIWSIPTLLLVIAITFALGKGFVQVFIAVGMTMWVEVARVVRGQVLSARNQEYVEAAKALGYRPARIIFKHILPNIMGPVIVVSAANFASAILLEAGLSFLGIGAQIPTPSWGQMIKEHYTYITTDMAYLAILPGICILMLVLSFMLIGSGLRDSLDTRSA